MIGIGVGFGDLGFVIRDWVLVIRMQGLVIGNRVRDLGLGIGD